MGAEAPAGTTLEMWVKGVADLDHRSGDNRRNYKSALVLNKVNQQDLPDGRETGDIRERERGRDLLH